MNFLSNILRKPSPLDQKTTALSVFGLNLASSDTMSDAISLWSDMYQNAAPWLSDKVCSLNLAAGIASELATSATIDMVSEVKGSPRAEFINRLYQHFLCGKRQYVELACAKGGIVFKPSLSGKSVSIDFIQPDSFIPVAFDGSGRLTSAVFIDRMVDRDCYFTRLEYHRFESGRYTIENRAFRSLSLLDLGKEIPLAAVPAWQELEPYLQIDNLKKPLFAYFKMPHSNTIDPYSPLGISAYAGVCDLIRDADELYSKMLWEFESGERALYLDHSAFRRDKNGNVILPDKRLYRTVSSDEALFHDWTPTLREENILRGLNAILKKIEFGCGLSFGTISDQTLKDRTAEEIRASKQRSYATICDIQIAFRNALLDLVECLDEFISLYSLAPCGEYSISFDFDDSIVADRTTEFQEKLSLLNCGILLPHEFRMWYLGEDEQTAKAILASKEEKL